MGGIVVVVIIVVVVYVVVVTIRHEICIVANGVTATARIELSSRCHRLYSFLCCWQWPRRRRGRRRYNNKTVMRSDSMSKVVSIISLLLFLGQSTRCLPLQILPMGEKRENWIQ
jgi:hypothetical protein